MFLHMPIVDVAAIDDFVANIALISRVGDFLHIAVLPEEFLEHWVVLSVSHGELEAVLGVWGVNYIVQVFFFLYFWFFQLDEHWAKNE